MSDIPLLGHADFDCPFACRAGESISVGRFLQDVQTLAQQLPARCYMLNLCADRYRFAVGFSAALLRGQVSLLPPNYTPDLVKRMATRYPDLYCLADGSIELVDIETFIYPAAMPASFEVKEIPCIAAEQCAALVFTSGSTGEPMPHPKTWGSLSKSAAVEAASFGVTVGSGMAVLGTVPAQHMYGLESTVLFAMRNGLVMVAERPFYAADICAQLAALPLPRCLVTTPIHLRSLLAEAVEMPAVDFVMCATAQLPLELASQAEEKFSAPLYEIYGCTEAGQVASRRPTKSAAWTLFSGITMRQDDEGTWVHGGHVEIEARLSDVIAPNADGTFTLHGRTTDLVNIAGKRTSLANLNYHLNNVPGVRDGVFIMPVDDGAGVARPIAIVVALGLTRDSVLEVLRLSIDAAFLPRQMYFVEALPRNATGKLTHDALHKLLGRLTQR